MFQKATKKKSKLKMALYGISGSGKTYSALNIATGISDKIALIDTEFGSASKYSDKFSFDVCELNSKSIDEYISAIKSASSQYDVLIIDSLTHAWQVLCEEVEKLAQTKYRGNTWSAWSVGNPKQKSLINAILSCDCHVIVTMRAKTEWTTGTNSNGKNTPQRVGLAPEQGKGIEFEFDFLASISNDHLLHFEKSRCTDYQNTVFEKPGKELGLKLKAWDDDGDDEKPCSSQLIKLQKLIKDLDFKPKRDINLLSESEIEQFIVMLEEKRNDHEIV